MKAAFIILAWSVIWIIVLAAAGALLFHSIREAQGPDAASITHALEVPK